jgi:transcriptional regulator with XRE-family HTH domain
MTDPNEKEVVSPSRPRAKLDELRVTMGRRARAARMRREMTQADAAELIGIATEVYGRLERGKMLPSVETLRKVSIVLGVSANELLGLPGDDAESIRQPLSLDRPEIRRLVRRARTLSPSRLKILETITRAFVKTSKRQ